MARSDPTSVPKTMRLAYEAVVRLTDEFCRERLNEEYRHPATRSCGAASHGSWTSAWAPASHSQRPDVG